MLAPEPQVMDIPAFLAWNTRREARHELLEGRPVRMMAGAKQSHNVVVGNIADALRRAAKAAGCRATSSDTAVATGPSSVRYPDIVVDCGPPDPDALLAARPTVLVEVLSPTTSQIDFTDKLDEYRGIETVELILLVDPDLVLVKAYRRAPDRSWRTARYDELSQVVDMPEIGGALALRDVYDTLSPKRGPRMEIVPAASGAD